MLSDIRDALLTVTAAVYHYEPPETVTGNYIVWAEDGEGSSGHGDNAVTTAVVEGTVDYYTKTEYDSSVDAIGAALSAAKAAHRINSIQYEAETGYIHYEWVWRAIA